MHVSAIALQIVLAMGFSVTPRCCHCSTRWPVVDQLLGRSMDNAMLEILRRSLGSGRVARMEKHGQQDVHASAQHSQQGDDGDDFTASEVFWTLPLAV